MLGRAFVAAALCVWCCSLCAAAEAAQPAAAEPTIEIVFVGDVMLDDGPGRVIARGGDPFAEFAAIFDRADLAIGNLECVVATGGQAEDKPWYFRAHPRCLPLLTRYFDAVGIANNHSGDYGKEALREQCELFEKAGLPYFGGGRDRAAAHRPAILRRNCVWVALLAYNDFPPKRFAAGDNSPGVAWIDEAAMLRDIRRAREEEQADVVIPLLHWGVEGDLHPEAEQVALARRLIDGGADAVIGAHPHRVQDIETYRGKPIFYSLGNFVFDGFDTQHGKTGGVARLKVGRHGVLSWEMLTARLDDRGVPHLEADQPCPMPNATGSARTGACVTQDAGPTGCAPRICPGNRLRRR